MGAPSGRRRRILAVLVAAIVAASCTTNPPPPTQLPTAPPNSTPGSFAPTPASSSPTFASSFPTPASSAPTPLPPAPTPPPAAPSPQAGLRLSEVRFAPAAGDPAFIEISNISASPVDLHGAGLSLDGTLLSLGRLSDPVPAAGFALVLLDSEDSTEGLTLHASAGFILQADSGVVALVDRTGLPLDRVAWGSVADAVPLTNGAVIPDTVEPGITIGRPPGLVRPSDPLDWVVYGPAEVTPGGSNGLPAPSVLMPLDGAIIDTAPAGLNWYPVPGAATYRMQAQQAGVTYAEPMMEVTTSSPDVPDVTTLGPGRYDWRVTAIAPDGTESLPSLPSQFEIVAAPSAVSHAGLALLADTPGKQLSVPLLKQHKDTAMLLLERNVESGPHAWDVAHPDLDVNDPADNMNCVLASTAMVNHYFGGDLSQDRIGYELRKDDKPGPEGDLNWDLGFLPDKTTRALLFALGVAPTHRDRGLTADDVWATTTASIDAGRPVVAGTPTHVVVFTGYSVVNGKRILAYNDPWAGSRKLDVDARAGAVAADFELWLLYAGSDVPMQEPTVTMDTDGDGVVDFDEIQRFHTDANRPDSDGDKVGDKQDILSGVFDPLYGYAVHGDTVGRDFDSDGEVTEHDPDSDGGGCTDGEEDTNADGHQNGSETSNFDVSDDRCERHGAYGQVTWISDSAYAEYTVQSETLTITVRFKDIGRAGLPEFVDDGSTYAYHQAGTGVFRAGSAVITAQGAYSGGGLIEAAGGVIVGGPAYYADVDREQFFLSASVPAQGQSTTDFGAFVETDTRGVSAQTLDGVTEECFGQVADLNARPRVYVFACHGGTADFSWSMTGSVTVAP